MLLRAAGAGLLGLAALLLPEVRSQLDFGESLESSKCSFANFQDRVNEVRLSVFAWRDVARARGLMRSLRATG